MDSDEERRLASLEEGNEDEERGDGSDAEQGENDEEQHAVVEPAFSKEGFLSKQGNFNSQWQRRWFCFRDGALKYYKSMGDETERGQIPLESLHVTEVPEDKYKRTLCFEVSSPTINRVFVLHADTQGELADWMRAITAASAALSALKQRRRTTAATAAQSRRVQELRARLAMPDSFRAAAGVSARASQWRLGGGGGLALAGLSASQASTVDDARLRLDVMPAADRLEFTACAALHNTLPALAIASNQGRASVVQIVRLADPRDFAAAKQARAEAGADADSAARSAPKARQHRMVSTLLNAIRGGPSASAAPATLSAALQHSRTASGGVGIGHGAGAAPMRVVQRFRLDASSSASAVSSERVGGGGNEGRGYGCASLSWYDDRLLVGAADGCVQFYKCPHGHSNSAGGGGLADHALEQTYRHAHLQAADAQTAHQPPPGAFGHSTRVHRVALNPVSKAAFLALENSCAHLWALEQPARPLHSERASSGALFGGCWNPHSGTELALGGQRRHLKVFDVRLLGASGAQSPVVWRVEHAHDDAIRDIAWSPLVPHWLATAGDDACVRVFDLRFGARPLQTMQCTNAVHSVAWSHAHAELLVSGGVDRKLRLWSMRLPGPHRLVDTCEGAPAFGHGVGHAIVATGFSRYHPHQYFGVSGAGEVAAVCMTDEFLDSMCQHRYGDERDEAPAAQPPTEGKFEVERRIESLLYRRDMSAAYALIAETTQRHWEAGRTEHVAQLLKLASSGLFASALQAGGAGAESSAPAKAFARMVRDAAYHFPPKCVKLSEPTAEAAQEIQLFKLRIALVKLLDADKYQDILSLENEILTHVERGGGGATTSTAAAAASTSASASASIAPGAAQPAFSVQTLLRVVMCVLPHDYLRALNLAYRLAQLFEKQNRFSDFVPITHALFYPTVYHDTVTPTAASALIKSAAGSGALPSLDAIGGGDDTASATSESTESDNDHDATAAAASSTAATAVSSGGKGSSALAGAALAAEVQRASKAQVTLDRDLRNPKIVLPQLGLLYEAFDAAHQPMPASAAALVELLEPHRKLLPQSLQRMFLHALLAARLYDKFFIFAAQLAQQLDGYRFAVQVRTMMDAAGMPRLRRFLDECCVGADRATPWDTQRPAAAALTLMNIVTNCQQVPAELRQCAPEYLKRCAALLRAALLEVRENKQYVCKAGSTPARDAAAVAGAIQQQLDAIQAQRGAAGSGISAAALALDPQIRALTQVLADARR